MKNKLLKSLFVLLTSLFASFTYAQSVSGTVSDDKGPLPGASVTVKGTNNGTQTDLDGKFTINNVGANPVLVISFIGLKTQEINVSGKSVITVVMQGEQEQLKEVIIVGYGSVKKKDATSAVESIRSDAFNKSVSTSPEQLLQGKSAGVQVVGTSGEPGVANTVRIRGAGSLRVGNDPLYVVDGVPIGGGNVSSGTTDLGVGAQVARNPLNFINPSDIASMDILKDASATAIYGSRGANGVIIITTKKGKKGEGQLTFNSSITSAKISNDYDLLDATTFAQNTAPSNNFGSNVNAFDDILRTGITQQYDLGFSGGGENGTYRLSFGYLDQEGIIKNTGLTKYNAALNMTQNMFNNKVKLEGSLSGSYIHDDAAALSSNVGAEGDLLVSALKWNPTRSYYNPDGTFLYISDNQRNPMDLLNNYTDYTKTARMLGNFGATIKLAKGLDYKFNVGADLSNSNRSVGMSKLIGVNNARTNNGIASKSSVIRSNYLVEHTLNYNTDVTSKLSLNALAGYSFQKFENQGNTFIGTGFGSYVDQNYYIDNITAATNYYVSGGNAQRAFYDPSNKLQSYFGRTIFTLSDKYILNAIIRADGSSKFGENNRYGIFPAVSLAWKVDKEAFAPDFFSDLKVRAGWGVTGNQEFPAGAALTQVVPIDGIPTIANIGNPDLKWEETQQLNFGIDYGILNNKLTGSIDIYKKETSNALFIGTLADPALYFAQWQNLKNTKIKTNGVELSLNYKIMDSEDFSWSVGGNIAFNKTVVNGLKEDGLATGIQTGNISGQGLSGAIAQAHFDGEETYTFNLYNFLGFDASGLAIYEDVNGDGNITDADLKKSGSANPDFNVGLNMNLRYKNWDFVANGYGAYGGKIYDNTSNAMFFQSALTNGNNVPSFVLNNGEAATGNSNSPSTRFLYSGDFFRLSNVQLGYTIKGGNAVFGSWLKSLRLYVTGSNLFVITPYKGFDPEVNSNKTINGIPSSGMDYASYPKSRAFTFGINVNL
jgi:TonB-dependent starch-binding outer membrane protein SusC